jgi:hypothetical protein
MSAQDFKPYISLTPTNASVTATGEIGVPYAPLAYPVIIRSIQVMPMVSGLNYDNLNVSLDIISLTSGSTASVVYTVTGTTADAAGKVIFKKGLNTRVSPGSRVFLNNHSIVTGAATIQAGIMVEADWEEPSNFTSVRVLT